MRIKKEYLRTILLSIIIGAVVSIVLNTFYFTVSKNIEFSEFILEQLILKKAYLPLYFLFVIAVGTFFSFVFHYYSVIKGSGIIFAMFLVRDHKEIQPIKILVSNYFLTEITIFLGLTLGTEAPSIMIGISISILLIRFFEHWFIIKNKDDIYLASIAVGFSMAFNVSFSGFTYALEEFSKKKLSLMRLITMIVGLASAIGVNVLIKYVTKFNRGTFYLENTNKLPYEMIGHYILFAIIIVFIAYLFNFILKITNRSILLTSVRTDYFIIPMLLLIGSGIVFIIPEIKGSGHRIMESVLNKNFDMIGLVLLLAFVMFGLVIAIASGAPGGFIFPILAIGVILGSIMTKIMLHLGLPGQFYEISVIIIGLAFFSAVLEVPITSFVLFLEFTKFKVNPTIMIIVLIVSTITCKLIKSKSLLHSLERNVDLLKIHQI